LTGSGPDLLNFLRDLLLLRVLGAAEAELAMRSQRLAEPVMPRASRTLVERADAGEGLAGGVMRLADVLACFPVAPLARKERTA
jgi:hypothetical protein